MQSTYPPHKAPTIIQINPFLTQSTGRAYNKSKTSHSNSNLPQNPNKYFTTRTTTRTKTRLIHSESRNLRFRGLPSNFTRNAWRNNGIVLVYTLSIVFRVLFSFFSVGLFSSFLSVSIGPKMRSTQIQINQLRWIEDMRKTGSLCALLDAADCR